MPRASTNKLYRTFVKGLITEAGPLTYPEDATTSEDNCILSRKGNRARRFGVDYESGYSLSTNTVAAASAASTAYDEYVWESVSNSDTNLLVVRIGTTLHFYDLTTAGSGAVSPQKKSFTVDMTPYIVSGATGADYKRMSMVGGKGNLIVVGEVLEPFMVTVDLTASTATASRIYITIRDFKGVDDGLANDEEPTTLSAAHHYNLRNQGWIQANHKDAAPVGTPAVTAYVNSYLWFAAKQSKTPPPSSQIQQYYTAHGRYPANNKQWWIAKKTSDPVGDFDPTLLNKFYFGNNRAPRGHYIVDAFNIDRSDVSGVSGIAVESTSQRPETVTFVSGRCWYALNDTVYFSQVMEDKRQAGMCHQVADPTAEDISDLIATDGGVIPIPEAAKIVRLVPTGSGVLVFATNGLWFITGTSAGFTATDFEVQKLSAIGTDSPLSIVEADSRILWWSKIGIQALSQGPEGLEKVNVSENTIQTFYNEEVPEEAKKYVKGYYDPSTNTVQWLFRDDTISNNYFYNRILNLDLTLGAFYPWTVSSASGRPYIVGAFLSDVIIDIAQNRDSYFKYIVAVPVSTNYKFTMGVFGETTFADWKTFQGSTGYAYDSYLETGYELLEDAMRKKAITYVVCLFRRTEEAFEADGSGDFQLTKPSSCKFRVKWDWSDSSASGKWSTEVEAYRLTRLPMFDESALTLDYGTPVVLTKNKVRGNGRAIQFRFSGSEIGKDFDLLGWAVAYTGQSQP